MRYIIIPQAFKRVIPPLGNEFIALLKDSSLVSVIGFEELTRRGQLVIARTYASLEIWDLCCFNLFNNDIIYFSFCSIFRAEVSN